MAGIAVMIIMLLKWKILFWGLVRNIEQNGRKHTKHFAADFNKIDPDIVMSYFDRWVDHIEIYRGIYAIFKRENKPLA